MIEQTVIAGGYLMSPISKFIHDALQPAEELGTFTTEEEYADAMLALAREATRRACLARGCTLLVATFDATGLDSSALGSLELHVRVQAESCDDEGAEYPDVPVTTKIFNL